MHTIHTEAFLFWGSAAGSALNIATTFLITRTSHPQIQRYGWLAALLVQIPWAVFGLLSGQYAFIALSVIYGVMYWQAYRTHPESAPADPAGNTGAQPRQGAGR